MTANKKTRAYDTFLSHSDDTLRSIKNSATKKKIEIKKDSAPQKLKTFIDLFCGIGGFHTAAKTHSIPKLLAAV